MCKNDINFINENYAENEVEELSEVSVLVLLTILIDLIKRGIKKDFKGMVLRTRLSNEEKDFVIELLEQCLLNKNLKLLEDYFESVLEHELMEMYENQIDEYKGN